MVKHLMMPYGRIALRIGTMLLLHAASLHASAQALLDPTQPPASLNSPVQSLTATQTASNGPMLQSVLISPTRAVAVISGETVRVGDKFGDAQVVDITEGKVVLRNGEQLQILKLFPGIEKLPASIYADGKLNLRHK